MKEAESPVKKQLGGMGRDEGKGMAEKQVAQWLDGQSQGDQTIGNDGKGTENCYVID